MVKMIIGFYRKELVRGLITKSAAETKKLGEKIANRLIVRGLQQKAKILALSGDLGSGKTTFVQGFARGLGIAGRIISPTFILMRKYSIKLQNSKIPKLQYFYHVDLYRLENEVEKEAVNLGLTDIWGRDENVVVIEWAEKIKNLIPPQTEWIFFEDLGGSLRKVKMKE